jgi:hypothetical protein
MSHRRLLTSGPQMPMPKNLQPRNAEPGLRKVNNARLAAPRGSNAFPEGQHTEVNAKTAAWQREHATRGVRPNRENALQEVSRREIATQEALQQAGSVTQEAPLEVVAGQAVQGNTN